MIYMFFTYKKHGQLNILTIIDNIGLNHFHYIPAQSRNDVTYFWNNSYLRTTAYDYVASDQ